MNAATIAGSVGQSAPDIVELQDLAAAGLASMFVAERGLFCHRLMRTDSGIQPDGISPRYTMMTLLGLHRYQSCGGRSALRVVDLLVELTRDLRWLQGDAGDLGLLLWTCAELEPDAVRELVRRTHAAAGLESSPQVKNGLTMEMAWLLTGVAKAAAADPSLVDSLKEVGQGCYRRLIANQGASGFFRHLSTSGATGRLRGRIGSFADQVYPILALTHFGTVFGVPHALEAAETCARAICASQGPLGQWWWHYDAPTGAVMQRYPVYSVHQDAMAPMALFAIADARGLNVTDAVLKGLAWIYGTNELGQDLRDLGNQVIWRSIRFSGRARLIANEAQMWWSGRTDGPARGALQVLHECRPYHLGWLLYAFAGRSVAAR